jgi:hypothetical protein
MFWKGKGAFILGVIDVFIDLNKATVYLSSELFPFFCMYIVLPFSMA